MPYLPSLHTVNESIDFFTRVVASNNVLIAEKDGGIVAYCAYRDGWLDHLYVHADYHGQGLGSRLLEMAKANCKSLRLWVFQKNTGAIRFYERHGFSLVRTTDGADNEEREPDALYTWKSSEGFSESSPLRKILSRSLGL